MLKWLKKLSKPKPKTRPRVLQELEDWLRYEFLTRHAVLIDEKISTLHILEHQAKIMFSYLNQTQEMVDTIGCREDAEDVIIRKTCEERIYSILSTGYKILDNLYDLRYTNIKPLKLSDSLQNYNLQQAFDEYSTFLTAVNEERKIVKGIPQTGYIAVN